MDTKITLSFNANVIQKAKKYAEENSISVSRLVEFLLEKITTPGYHSLEDYPISDWVSQVAEGEATYQTNKKRTSKSLKDDYFASRKK